MFRRLHVAQKSFQLLLINIKFKTVCLCHFAMLLDDWFILPNIVFTCTSLHKQEQKDRIKILAEFPDYHISIDYRSKVLTKITSTMEFFSL
jgi:hypothetical protein